MTDEELERLSLDIDSGEVLSIDALRSVRERCAQQCEAVADELGTYPSGCDRETFEHAMQRVLAAKHCAAAIRGE